MSSTGSSGDAQAYFQAIEERFIRLRGAPLLLSPADWQIARGWHLQGIPVALVLETLEAVFASRHERGVKGRVQGLRYCAPAVERAWEDHRELQGTGERRKIDKMDPGKRLQVLARSLTASQEVPREIVEKLAAIEGAPETIEAQLANLDREMLELASGALDPPTLQEIRSEVADSLRTLRERLGDSQVAEVEGRLVREAVRRRLNLPLLSLFSPDIESG